jgi:4-amino-4-deoxy-L-arabinose transferase-like glycosyltransferase
MIGWSWLERYGVAWCLAAIVFGAASLALVWVFLVPIYEAPDEHLHLDYAFCIYDNGGLIRAKGLPEVVTPAFLHPDSLYLIHRAHATMIPFNYDAKVPPDYGTRSFYRSIDAGAPQRGSFTKSPPHSLLACYPYGYYALLAVWIGILRHCSDSLTFVFFGSRVFSVLLLMVSLVLVFATARELGLRRRRALLLTACVGFFPLTTFVSSYVQPDNLSFTLVSLCLYLTLVARRRAGDDRVFALLGLAFGMLCVTKQHYFACTLAATLPTLAVALARRPAGERRWIRSAALLAAPTAILGAVHLWTIWGSTNFHTQKAHSPDALIFALAGFKKALLDFYSGTTHLSFWGIFGWLDAPLVIRGSRTDALFRFSAQAATLVVLALALVRLQQVACRLAGVARRGRWLAALRIAVSNPVLNGYFLFTVLMVLLYIWTDNRFTAQGRNWLPFLPAIILTAVVYAPRALATRGAQRACARLLTAGLVVYVAAGEYYAVKTLQKRYYTPRARRNAQEVRMDARPVIQNDMIWKDRGGDGTGPDPYVVFALERPRFVNWIQLRYVLNGPPGAHAFFRTSWAWAKKRDFTPDKRTAYINLATGPDERTLTISVNESIDQLRFHPGVAGCHFEVRDLVLMAAEAYPATSLARAGEGRDRR